MFPYTTNVTLVAEWHKIVNPIHLLLITLHMMLPPLLFDAHDNNQDPTALLALFARRGNEESWFWHPDDDLCQCFFSLTQLDSESLLRLRTTLTSLDSKYQERFSVDIERGIRDIDWVIMEKQLYSNLMTLGDAPTVESDAIVSDDSSEDATNSDYLRVLLADRKWTELSKMEVSEVLAWWFSHACATPSKQQSMTMANFLTTSHICSVFMAMIEYPPHQPGSLR